MAPRPRFPQLDGLRAVAIVSVLVGHEALHRAFGGWSGCAMELAKVGVLLFFVLSGFLITTLLCLEDDGDGRIRVGAFYLRRALRILPAMLVYVGAVVLLASLGKVADVGWVDLAAALFYVRNVFGHSPAFTHLWSLSLEEQFYLVWPLALVLLDRRARLPVAVAVAVVIAAWRAIAIGAHLFDANGAVYYERTDFRLDSILAGCALALALRADHPRVASVATSILRRLPAVPVAGALLLVAFATRRGHSTWALTVEALLAVILLGRLIVVAEGPTHAALCAPPMRWIGRVSYSWYLWQELFVVPRDAGWGWLRTTPFDLLASLAVACASYYLVEQPFLRWKGALEGAQLQVRVASSSGGSGA